MSPTRPETGFGYLKCGEERAADIYDAEAFVEKPNPDKAAQYLRDPKYVWNAGMFFFTVNRLMAEADAHLPSLAKAMRTMEAAPALAPAAETVYGNITATSIDYGIMERAKGIRVVRGDFGWNDVGSWDAIPEVHASDAEGNVTMGDVVSLDCANGVIISDTAGPAIGAYGIRNCVVVATHDAVLVLPRGQAQHVRELVDQLKANGRKDLL